MVYREVSMIEIKEILLRITSKSSIRNISDSLSIHRDTIKNYIELARKNGFDPYKDSKDMITDELIQKIKSSTSISKNKNLLIPRDELLLPHKETIEKYLKSGLKGSKIIILLARSGIVVTKASFYRFLRNSCESYNRKNITVRLPEVDPGLYCQADFGRLGKIWDKAANKLRVAWALVITLCYSRHMFVFITFKQDMLAVISGFEAAWAYFGGTTELVIVDNVKTIVDKSNKCDPRINKTFLEYAQYRQFTPDPCDVACPRGKPIVERNVPYVRDNFFAGETFLSREDCQERAVDWCTNTAGTRIHGTIRLKPIELFNNLEKEKMSAYDSIRYDIPYYASPVVHTDHHISFKKSLYSLPTKYIGKTVDVRGDSALVRISFKDELIKTHPRLPEGKRSTDYDDYPKEITPYTLRNANYQISEGNKKHPAIGDYIEFLLSGTYPWHRLRSAQKLLRLAEKYGHTRTAAACIKAKEYGIWDVRRIERMLKNNVEENTVLSDFPTLFTDSPRFARDGSYFKNYN